MDRVGRLVDGDMPDLGDRGQVRRGRRAQPAGGRDVTVTATTGQGRAGHYAHCDRCGWWQRTAEAKDAVMAAWTHRCKQKGEAE